VTRKISIDGVAVLLLGLLALTSCRKHPPPPPPPARVTPPITTGITAIPAPTPATPATPVAPASSFHYVQAIGVSDSSVLISVDIGSHRPMRSTGGVPLPPGFTPHTLYMVVNLADGCVRSPDSFPMVDEAASATLTLEDTAVFDAIAAGIRDGGTPSTLPIAPRREHVTGPARVLPIVNGASFHEQFAREQTLFAEFDARADGVSAWSEDGKRVLFASDDQMYRSDDGVTFSVIDVNASYVPKVTRDGRLGIYRRCTHPCGGGYRLAEIALGHASSPRFVVGPNMHDFAFDPDEKSAVYVREAYAREAKDANKLCIERLDLDHGGIVSLACEPSSDIFSESVLSIADDASFGALQTYDGKPGNGHLIIYDLRTGARSRSIEESANVPPVDSDGNVGLDAIAGSTEARVSNASGIANVGSGEPLAWDHQKRLVLLHRELLTTAPPFNCGVVSADLTH
jgi:hypothetical protein